MVKRWVLRAIQGNHKEYYFRAHADYDSDLDASLARRFGSFMRVLQQAINRLPQGHGIKIQFKMYLALEKYSFELERDVKIELWFLSDVVSILNRSDIKMMLQTAIASALSRFDSFVREGSGWIMKKVLLFCLKVMKFKLIHGGCRTMPLPKSLRQSKSVLSINSGEQDKCFLYCIAAGLVKSKANSSRVTKLYKQLLHVFPSHFQQFPISIKEIMSFEKNVPISVNVYGFSKRQIVFPYYVSQYFGKRSFHFNLLLYKEHYYLIKNLPRLLLSKELVNTRKHYVCPRCLAYFNVKLKYKLHQTLCGSNSLTPHLLQLPEENTKLSFKNYSNLIQAPFIIYADFESSISNVNVLNKGKLYSVQKHMAISWGSITVCRDNDVFNSQPVLYTGEDCIPKFFDYLEGECARILSVLHNVNLSMEPLTMEEEHYHESASKCFMCKRSFSLDFMSMKIHDHCHLNGKFRFTLCQTCNFTFAKTKIGPIYVFFHGLSNYDSHFIMNYIQRYDSKYIKIIPKTSEKYLSFSVGPLQFKDSFQFLPDSLANLVFNLKQKGEFYFKNINRTFPDATSRSLLYQKGIFPYNYITSLDVLKEDKLPPKEAFFNDLNNESISDHDYEFAKIVWSQFHCKSLKDYMHIYLLADCLLLADCFEAFRSNCLQDYELDPAHYFSSAHLSFDAYLRKTDVKLQLFHDINHYLFVTKAKRGGLSMVSKRYAKANHPFLGEIYDPQQKNVFILYLDCNNLYGKAMSEYLPYADFAWNSTISLEDILNTSDTASTGYFIECTLEYPPELHDAHNDYPLAPEHCTILSDQWSPYCQEISKKHGIQKNAKVCKLLATFYTKDHYVLHYRNLKLYVSLGLKVKSIHKVLQFSQSPIIKPYIDFNSLKRAQAKNEFDIAFYKFLSNSLFGKTMENPENKVDIKLVNTIEKYEKLVSKLTFKNAKVINKDLVSLELRKEIIKLMKPYYLGIAILELAKTYMYDFHYNYFKKVYGNRVHLLYTDTDSLIYEIHTDDLYKDLETLFPKPVFDFSNYPKENRLFSDIYKKIPGYFKDECKGQPIESFVGLRSKMYAFKLKDQSEQKAAKGVKKTVIRDLKYDSYYQCLIDNLQYEHAFKNIRSTAHSVYTFHQKKTSLSCFDDKRWLLNPIDSLAYGHYKIAAVESPPVPV